MQVRSFFMTMGAGIAVGALGAMMLPKNSEVYKTTGHSGSRRMTLKNGLSK